MPSRAEELLTAAQSYAERGWLVLPLHSVGDEGECTCGHAACESAGKHPRTKNGLHDASRDPEQITTWWTHWPEANIGIRSGKVSGIFCLDIDSREAAVDLGATGRPIPPDACSQQTGRGWQVLFQTPDALVKNSSGKIAPEVDIRGEGGYFVAPPSRHVNGKIYRWRSTTAQPGPAPEWLLSEITESKKPASQPRAPWASTGGQRERAYVAAALREETARVRAALPGTRNDTLNQAAFALGQLEQLGLDRQDAEADLLAAALAAGLDEAGARKTFASGWRAGTGKPRTLTETHHLAMVGTATSAPPEAPGEAGQPRFFPRTDAGNGELFAHLYRDQTRYDHKRHHWLIWDGHHWRQDADGEVRRLAIAAARSRYQLAVLIPDLGERQQEAKFAMQSENKARLDAMLGEAKNLPPLAADGEHWDQDPWLFGVGNGVLDLRTGVLRPGRPEDDITFFAEVSYNPDAECPRWRTFLEEVFDLDTELIDFIWRAVGYSLTGITIEQCLFLCHGRGANGKSIFLALLRALAGRYSYNAPFSTFEMKARSEISHDVAALAGRRLVTASETNDSTRLNEARVKALTGCDPMTARHLYAENFTFKPVAKFFFAANHLPSVADDSYGFWRRVRLLPFVRQFTTDADPELEAKLLTELPGILAWAVQGAHEWQVRGLTPPAAVVKATEDYREKSDVLADFIADELVVGEGRTVGATEAYTLYKAWAHTQGMSEREMLSTTKFGARMRTRFTPTRTSKLRGYAGVGLPGGPVQDVLG